jgi:hypothetical protein
MLLKRLVKVFTSLRLTAVLLALGIILVFVGTVAQADEGLYYAQSRYFKQWVVVGITMFGRRLPIVLPGGYLIGTALLINLIAAHTFRFRFAVKKIGILVAHAGIILLLAGQLATDVFSRESHIRFTEGQTKVYSESASDYELAFVTPADARRNHEIVIPAARLAPGAEISDPALPFTIRVKHYDRNSEPVFRAPMMQHGPPESTNGVATAFDFHPAEESRAMDGKNAPTVEIELTGQGGSLGDWVVSSWCADPDLQDIVEAEYTQQANAQMAREIVGQLALPQKVVAAGKEYTLLLRPARIYNPFSLTLLKATHSFYQGTDTPKDYRSRVRLVNANTGENREVDIYMNNPLRYGGLTFYQYQMPGIDVEGEAGHAPWSALQVVRNPSWVTPYLGCLLVATGLVVQFGMHLAGFISKRRTV